MAVNFNLSWAVQGAPRGFIVARYDITDRQWWVMYRNGSAKYELLSSFLARDPFTLGQAGGNPTTYSGLIMYDAGETFNWVDTCATKDGALFYQIAEYFDMSGMYSDLDPDDPYTAARWLSPNPHDHLVTVTNPFVEDARVKSLESLLYPANTEVGQLSIVSPIAGSGAAWASVKDVPGFTNSKMLELSGASSVRVEGDLLVHDLSGNILVWN